jgi:hypothetical protein
MDVCVKAGMPQVPAVDAKQRSGHEIGLGDLPVGGQREVTNRRELVEIRIAVARRLQGRLRFPQCLVLHLQLDLMHLEFVQHIGDRLRRPPGGRIANTSRPLGARLRRLRLNHSGGGMKEHKALLATMRQARRDFFACQTMIASEVAWGDMIDEDLTDRELGAAGKALLIEADRMERAAARFKARVRYLLCQNEIDADDAAHAPMAGAAVAAGPRDAGTP